MDEIRNCPSCDRACSTGRMDRLWFVSCGDSSDMCGYSGPYAKTEADAISKHNLIASAVPTDKLRQLEAKWRERPFKLADDKELEHEYPKTHAAWKESCKCADELSALIKGDSNG